MNQSKTQDRQLSMLALTIPIFLEQMLKILVSSIDTVMLSGYSEEGVASVGMMSQYLFFMNILFNVVCTGTSIVLTQYLGAKKSKGELTSIAQASTLLITIFSAVLTAAVFAGTNALLGCYTLEPLVRQHAHDYFIIFGGIGGIFTGFSLMQGAILRSYGHTKEILIVSIFANIINVLGNAISLCGWFGMPVFGVPGVAFASVASQMFSCIALAIIINRKEDVCFAFSGIFNVPKNIYRSIFKIGIPTAGENISYNVAQIVIMAMITTLGTAAMSAQVYTQTIVRFVFVFASAIGNATQIKTGHMVGAKQLDAVYRQLYKYQIIGTGLSLALILLVNLIKPVLIGIFTQNTEVVALVSTLLIYSVYIEFGRSLNLISIAGLKGAGDVKFPVLYGLFSMWGIMVLGSYVLGLKLGLGLVGFWIAIGSDETSRGIVMLFRWKSKKWQNKALV